MEQLQRNVLDFRAGTLLPDVTRRDGYRVLPIIVSPSEWPRAYTLGWYVPQVVAETGWLGGCEPLELLDAGEVERLESIARDGISITQLLVRKQTSAHDRIQSLHNYLLFREPNLLSGQTATEQRGSRVARRLMDLAQSWGAPPLED
jgi:hypothetical protein